MMTSEKLEEVLAQVRAKCESNGMKMLPPLTEQDHVEKFDEILARQARNSRPAQRSEMVNEAEVMEKFYSTGRFRD